MRIIHLINFLIGFGFLSVFSCTVSPKTKIDKLNDEKLDVRQASINPETHMVILDTFLQDSSFLKVYLNYQNNSYECSWGSKNWQKTISIRDIVSHSDGPIRDIMRLIEVTPDYFMLHYSYGTRDFDNFLFPRKKGGKVKTFYQPVLVDFNSSKAVLNDLEQYPVSYKIVDFNGNLVKDFVLTPLKDTFHLILNGLQDIYIMNDSITIEWESQQGIEVDTTFSILD